MDFDERSQHGDGEDGGDNLDDLFAGGEEDGVKAPHCFTLPQFRIAKSRSPRRMESSSSSTVGLISF